MMTHLAIIYCCRLLGSIQACAAANTRSHTYTLNTIMLVTDAACIQLSHTHSSAAVKCLHQWLISPDEACINDDIHAFKKYTSCWYQLRARVETQFTFYNEWTNNFNLSPSKQAGSGMLPLGQAHPVFRKILWTAVQICTGIPPKNGWRFVAYSIYGSWPAL
jgi:hypothetical protein